MRFIHKININVISTRTYIDNHVYIFLVSKTPSFYVLIAVSFSVQGYIHLCVKRKIFGDSSTYLRSGVSRKIFWGYVKYALRLTPKFWG